MGPALAPNYTISDAITVVAWRIVGVIAFPAEIDTSPYIQISRDFFFIACIALFGLLAWSLE